ncbi:major facilitator superfamily domain-containing protein [Chlamydoabsidia padenii]|nr:major facilitator superfamily domain-containing protein [Chlamydoabsidia padenii]
MALRIEGAMGFGLLALATALAYSNPDISSIKRPPFRIVHRDLLDGSYILMLIYCSLCFVGYFGTFFLAPPYAAHLGYSAIDGAKFVAIMSGMTCLSRVITGILADRCGNINVMFSCALISGLFTSILWQNSTSYNIYATYCVLNGFTGGVFIALLPVVVADIVGVENLQRGIGLCYLLCTVGNLAGPPIATKLFEMYGWAVAIQFLGTVILISSMILLLLRIKRSNRQMFVKV